MFAAYNWIYLQRFTLIKSDASSPCGVFSFMKFLRISKVFQGPKEIWNESLLNNLLELLVLIWLSAVVSSHRLSFIF